MATVGDRIIADFRREIGKAETRQWAKVKEDLHIVEELSIPIPFKDLGSAMGRSLPNVPGWVESVPEKVTSCGALYRMRNDDLGELGVLFVQRDGGADAIVGICDPEPPASRAFTPEEAARIRAITDPDKQHTAAASLGAEVQQEANDLHLRRKEHRDRVIRVLFDALGQDPVVGERWRKWQEADEPKLELTPEGRSELEALVSETLETEAGYDALLEPGHRLTIEDLKTIGELSTSLESELQALGEKGFEREIRSMVMRLRVSAGHAPDPTCGRGGAPDKGEEAHRKELASPEDYVFRKSGDVWEIVYEGSKLHLRHVKGLAYIAYLLRNPNRGVGVLELVASVEKNLLDDRATLYDKMTAEQLAGEGLRVSREDQFDDILDEETLQSYRKRLHELNEMREEAMQVGDTAKVTECDEETEWIAKEWRRSQGLGGRRRRLGRSSAEKARLSIQQRIKYAKDKIRSQDPALFKHLNSTISTGYECVYRPDELIPWSL